MRTKGTAGGDGGLVYSTEQGRMCPGCSRPVGECACQQKAPSNLGDSIVRVGRETKGRKGGGVTVVTGLALGDAELAELCTRLKKRCGSGGTLKDGVIEIQGEHRDTVVAELTKQGFAAKRAGG